MYVFLSCDRNDKDFIAAVMKAVDEVNLSIGAGTIELVFPPTGIGGDRGTVLANLVRIRECELVLFDVTPPPGEKAPNPGVLVELGFVLGMDNPLRSAPWSGVLPKPKHRVFCHESVVKRDLPPLVNNESIRPYSLDSSTADFVGTLMKEAIAEKVRDKIDFTVDSTGQPMQQANPPISNLQQV